jgi:hypothetical protein
MREPHDISKGSRDDARGYPRRLNGVLYDEGLEYAIHIMRRRSRLKIVPPGGAA